MEEKNFIEVNSNNRRIAKNTLMLYARMLLIMLISLYTVRVVLNTLGTVDYGIYNVVGAIVVMFSFISNSMASASQRFFAFELGRKDYDQLKKVFSLTLSIHIVISVLIFILAETIGLWFLNTQMKIPTERMTAAFYVYQFSIFSFIITLIRAPFNASIIAHEKMDFYAWLSIFEVVLKLFIVLMLVRFNFDKLKLYAILTFFITILITLLYYLFCIRKFTECKFKIYWNKTLFNTLFGFTSWNLFGNLAVTGMQQGINILLNIFFGPVVNAARGIAFQVSANITAFVGNFQIAVSPQIIKYYAAGEKKNMEKLLFQSSRLSYYLLFIISLPVFLEIKPILTLWLKNVPEYTVIFTRLGMICALVDCFSGTIIPVIQATGTIKKYQLIVGLTLLCNLPISYGFLRLGFRPQITMIIAIGISFLSLFFRLIILKELLNISIKKYLNEVVFKDILISFLAAILPFFLNYYIKQKIVNFILIFTLACISTSVIIYALGLNTNERLIIKKMIMKYIQR